MIGSGTGGAGTIITTGTGNQVLITGGGAAIVGGGTISAMSGGDGSGGGSDDNIKDAIEQAVDCAIDPSLAGCAPLPSGGNKSDSVSQPQVVDTKLENIFNNVYKGTTNPNRVGDGTLMDAVIYEVKSGNKVHGRGHITKAEETIRGLKNWLKKEGQYALEIDRQEAILLIDQLEDALKGVKTK